MVMMCGLSFSGKSTFARLLARELDAAVVSLDAINEERGLHGGEGIPGSEWATTHRVGEERVSALLGAGTDVIVDDTGSPGFVREHWRDIANRAGAEFSLVWVQIDPELQRTRLLENRESGTRHDVSDQVMSDHISGFEPPLAEDAILVDARDVRDAAVARRIADELNRGGAGVAGLGFV